jgi:hypothetical protein
LIFSISLKFFNKINDQSWHKKSNVTNIQGRMEYLCIVLHTCSIPANTWNSWVELLTAFSIQWAYFSPYQWENRCTVKDPKLQGTLWTDQLSEPTSRYHTMFVISNCWVKHSEKILSLDSYKLTTSQGTKMTDPIECAH